MALVHVYLEVPAEFLQSRTRSYGCRGSHLPKPIPEQKKKKRSQHDLPLKMK